MNEMRVCIESRLHTSEEIRSAWFTLPIDEEELEEQIAFLSTVKITVSQKWNCLLLMKSAKIRLLKS